MISSQTTKDHAGADTAFSDTIMHVLDPILYNPTEWYNLNDHRG